MKPDPMWRLPAAGCTNLSNTGNVREILFDKGYRRLEVLLAEGTQLHQANINELLDIGPRLIREGWTICSWHSTAPGNNPVEEANVMLRALTIAGKLISGHNLNAEDWYEHLNRWKTGAYWNIFRQGSNLPVACWPMGSDTGESPRDFDYQSCIDMGCMIYPQQYQNVWPSFTIAAGEANLNCVKEPAKIPLENRGTSPGVYGPNIPWSNYRADLLQIRRPVLLYAVDLAGFDPELAGDLVLPDIPPEEDDVQPVGKNDGIAAMYNRLRDLDPKGTILKKGADGKWPPLSSIANVPLDQWKAYDKAQRKDQILKDDHDEMVS